jgi:hypothetical protein
MMAPAQISMPGSRWTKRGRGGAGPLVLLRAFSLLGVVALVSAGCTSREEVVYVDDASEHAENGAAAYTPFARSTDSLVHRDGAHEAAPSVQIGPAHSDGDAPPYTPFAGSHEPLVHAGDDPHVVATVALAYERGASAEHGESASASSESSHGSTEASKPAAASAAAALSNQGAPAVAGAPAGPSSGNPANGARPAASPTPPARLALGPGLGATPGTPTPKMTMDVGDDDDHRNQATIAGKIESISGSTLKVQTQAGPQTLKLAPNVRVDRDAVGGPADLKPGQFVGVVHLPMGPADSIRLYATGPTMPAPGIGPLVGSRSGQVTTFGSVVGLQFGGLLLNTGSQTTTVALPNNVPILRSAPQDASALAAGAQVLATGPVGEDGMLTATAVRVTSSTTAATR